MAEAGGQAVASAAEAAEGETEFPAQLVEVATATVLQLAALEQVPDPFIGIKFGRIRRQPFEMQARRRPRREEVFDGLAAVDGRAIPDHEQLAAHLAQQLPQEGNDRRAAIRRLLEVGKEATIGGEGADRREMVA